MNYLTEFSYCCYSNHSWIIIEISAVTTTKSIATPTITAISAAIKITVATVEFTAKLIVTIAITINVAIELTAVAITEDKRKQDLLQATGSS